MKWGSGRLADVEGETTNSKEKDRRQPTVSIYTQTKKCQDQSIMRGNAHSFIWEIHVQPKRANRGNERSACRCGAMRQCWDRADLQQNCRAEIIQLEVVIYQITVLPFRQTWNG